MLGILKYEFRRLFRDRKNLVFFLILLLISLYFVHSGIRNYQKIQDEKYEFIKVELDLLDDYETFKQYSNFGFRLMAEPSPLNIFFDTTSIWGNLRAHVDTTPSFEIYDSTQGKLFFKRYFKDFAGMVYFVGSLMMIYLGGIGIRGLSWLKFKMQFVRFPKFFFISAFSRVAIANGFFALIFVFGFLYTKIFFIEFSYHEVLNYFLHCGFTLVLMTFFYFTGFLITVVLKFRGVSYIWMIFIWVIFIFFLPELNRLDLGKESPNFWQPDGLYRANLTALLNFEKEAGAAYEKYKNLPDDQKDREQRLVNQRYKDSTLVSIKNRESNTNKKLRSQFRSYEINSVWFPTNFYNMMTTEVSSKGYNSYLDFRQRVHQVQSNFTVYFLEECYVKNSKEVKGFLVPEDHVFLARSSLPRLYWIGLLSTFFYVCILAILSFLGLKFHIFKD